MKYSKQRTLIEHAVKDNQIHPTADDVYTILKPHNPNLSLGTVYRNLNLLAEAGSIRKLSVPGGSDRFDGILTEHYHVICTSCGLVFDCALELANMDDLILSQTGVTITSHDLIFKGICENCRSKS